MPHIYKRSPQRWAKCNIGQMRCDTPSQPTPRIPQPIIHVLGNDLFNTVFCANKISWTKVACLIGNLLPLRPLRRPKTDAITIWIGRTTICWIQLLDVVHHTKLRRVGTISCILIAPTCWPMANFTTRWYGKPWRRRLLLRIPSLRPCGIVQLLFFLNGLLYFERTSTLTVY